MNHTLEPWGVLNVPLTNRKCHKKLGPLIIVSGDDTDILRAQSCVNALAGLNPEGVRDVVEALENLLAVKNGEGGTMFDSDEMARAALAKVRAQA